MRAPEAGVAVRPDHPALLAPIERVGKVLVRREDPPLLHPTSTFWSPRRKLAHHRIPIDLLIDDKPVVQEQRQYSQHVVTEAYRHGTELHGL
jgi:hypothetical protein